MENTSASNLEMQLCLIRLVARKCSLSPPIQRPFNINWPLVLESWICIKQQETLPEINISQNSLAIIKQLDHIGAHQNIVKCVFPWQVAYLQPSGKILCIRLSSDKSQIAHSQDRQTSLQLDINSTNRNWNLWVDFLTVVKFC